ncbi:ABC transporter permease subunit [Rhodobacteraceae bacterium KN286]|uniref:ABC transporter permease subunit n=2 Tax=Oceanomicrobium pacificus TaxID=2692916 RepID=A0A6B0TRN1_9RHOB|nr:ABC transporter permease subunit [Oceanomicrobium pacificus]
MTDTVSNTPATAAPAAEAPLAEHNYQLLSVRQLMWRKFLANRLAVLSALVLILLYLATIFAGFVAPYGPQNGKSRLSYAPPTPIQFCDDAGCSLRPFVHPVKAERSPVTFLLEFVADEEVREYIYFFERGDSYKVLGLVTSDLHLFGLRSDDARIALLGHDQRGRDLFSRIVYGGQVSLTVGLIGVLIMVMLGAVIGALSGYYGGWFDNFVQRFIETLRVFPEIPLWMALSAAIPPLWPPEWVYAGIVVVLAFLGWTGLAREVRGLTLSLKKRDFVMAAEASGASTGWIMRKHLIPNMLSHIIVTATLAVPVTILGESALSFLGIGVRPPMISWGLLLSDAFKVQVIALYPWMLFPAAFIFITVLAFNFLGDGLRDMVDPFS